MTTLQEQLQTAVNKVEVEVPPEHKDDGQTFRETDAEYLAGGYFTPITENDALKMLAKKDMPEEL